MMQRATRTNLILLGIVAVLGLAAYWQVGREVARFEPPLSALDAEAIKRVEVRCAAMRATHLRARRRALVDARTVRPARRRRRCREAAGDREIAGAHTTCRWTLSMPARSGSIRR